MRNAFVLLLIAFTMSLNAQENIRKQAAADFRAVNEAYTNSDKLRMDVNYTLFPSYTSLTPFEKERGVFMKEGKNTYSNLLGIVSLSNSKVSLTLDSNEQVIVVADPAGKRNGSPSMVDMDTLLGSCSSVEYKLLAGDLKFYKMKFDGVLFSEYDAIEVYIDPKSNFISRLMLYYRVELDLDEEGSACAKDKPRMEIVYSNIDTNPVFNTDQFSETRMLRPNGKSFSPAPAYSKFRIVNNRIN